MRLFDVKYRNQFSYLSLLRDSGLRPAAVELIG